MPTAVREMVTKQNANGEYATKSLPTTPPQTMPLSTTRVTRKGKIIAATSWRSHKHTPQPVKSSLHPVQSSCCLVNICRLTPSCCLTPCTSANRWSKDSTVPHEVSSPPLAFTASLAGVGLLHQPLLGGKTTLQFNISSLLYLLHFHLSSDKACHTPSCGQVRLTERTWPHWGTNKLPSTLDHQLTEDHCVRPLLPDHTGPPADRRPLCETTVTKTTQDHLLTEDHCETAVTKTTLIWENSCLHVFIFKWTKTT